MKTKLITLLLLFYTAVGVAQTAKVYTTNGVAIKGYDPVAYFLQNKAVEGNDQFTFDWNGSKWKFASQANVDSFKVAPEKYAPQYGGYCAYGCSENHKSPTDPNAFTIVDNKLYLNYSLKVKSFWLKDTTSRIKDADAYWNSLKN